MTARIGFENVDKWIEHTVIPHVSIGLDCSQYDQLSKIITLNNTKYYQ